MSLMGYNLANIIWVLFLNVRYVVIRVTILVLEDVISV